MLYANNYEQVDEDHPIVERLEPVERALAVFRDGASMAKGTTTAIGLGHSYFANIFGPPQYKDLHEPLAKAVFGAAFEAGVFVGQMRTRLGIPGYESSGPREAAEALFRMIAEGGGPRRPDHPDGFAFRDSKRAGVLAGILSSRHCRWRGRGCGRWSNPSSVRPPCCNGGGPGMGAVAITLTFL